ncbi:MAG: hypothetical protein Salg2KO_17720 [Salibacteraceae bacterium]
MKLVALCLLLSLSVSNQAQRKMPNFTFMHNSCEYANANRSLDDDGQYADTLHDVRVVRGLVKILKDNPNLAIRLVGHAAANENVEVAKERADRVKTDLIDSGIAQSRIQVESEGSSKPIISNQTILSLNSAVEKEAANQRNRRVEVSVVRDNYDAP